jgi:hypothetical protein
VTRAFLLFFFIKPTSESVSLYNSFLESQTRNELMEFLLGIYPSHFKLQISASRERVSYKALIEENSYSIV